MTKDSFKQLVRKKVEAFAFDRLRVECASQSKTKGVVFDKLQMQPYFNTLHPHDAKIVLKSRAKCLEIKDHRPYKHSNDVCRWCNMESETLPHIVNCGWDDSMTPIDLDSIKDIDELLEAQLISLVSRIENFIERVDY